MRNYSSYNEKELTDLLRSGDTFAFTEIYNRYWNKLTAVAYNYTRDKSSAKEIVQELFVGVWNRRETLHIQNLDAYLGTAAKFAVFKQVERERRRREIEAKEHRQDDFSLDEQQIELKFLQEYISGLVEQLPEKCRLVFNYSRMQGMTIPEIANEMNIAEKTVEGHLTKGIKTLKLNLKDSGLLVIAVGSSIHWWLK